MRTALPIVLLFFIGSVWALPCVYSDDAFGAELESRSLFLPRKAVYLAGAKKREPKIKNELMVRSLPLFPGKFKDMLLVISKRDLTGLPHTKPGDKVYDLSAFFPNCNPGKSYLWVIYNASSGYIIANVDPLLSASVNEYRHNIVVKQITKVRLSATYLLVDKNIPLEIKSLKQAKHQRIMSVAGEFRSGEKVNLSNFDTSVKFEMIACECGRDADIILNFEARESEKSIMSATFEFGKENIMDLGITEGNTRKVMIFTLINVDILGREIEVHESIVERVKTSENIFYDWRCKYCPYGIDVADLSINMPVNLVVPPNDPLFRKDDVIYDLKDAMSLQGIKMLKGDRLFYNKTCGQIMCICSYENYEQIQELFVNLGKRQPPTLRLSANLYEVNSIHISDSEWTLESVLASNPIFLGSASCVTRSGERAKLKSLYGKFIWEPIIGESGYHLSHELGIDVNLLGCHIKSIKEEFITRKKIIFIELQSNAETKKSIVMMMTIKVDRIGYHEKLHNPE